MPSNESHGSASTIGEEAPAYGCWQPWPKQLAELSCLYLPSPGYRKKSVASFQTGKSFSFGFGYKQGFIISIIQLHYSQWRSTKELWWEQPQVPSDPPVWTFCEISWLSEKFWKSEWLPSSEMGEPSASTFLVILLSTVSLNWEYAHPSWHLRFASVTAKWIPNIWGRSPSLNIALNIAHFFYRCVSEGWCLEGHSTGFSRQLIFKEYVKPLCKWKVLISTCHKSTWLHPKTRWGSFLQQPTSAFELGNCWKELEVWIIITAFCRALYKL